MKNVFLGKSQVLIKVILNKIFQINRVYFFPIY